MADAPLRYRLAVKLLGSQAKSFIPPLSAMGMGFDSEGRLKKYATKPEQLTANLGWAYAANTAIVEPASAIEITLWHKKGNGDREQVKEHELLDLLDSPNLVHTGEQQRQLHYTYMNFTGEAYEVMLKNGEPFIPTKGQLPHALHVIPAHEVSFELGETYTKSKVKWNQEEYPVLSVVRDINPDPLNPYFGRSIISAAAATIDTDEQMKSWNRRFFANNARPSLIFSTDQALDDDAYERFKTQFADEHTGTDNAYKPILIENGKATPWMMSQTDLDFLNSRKFSKDEILAMFKTSPGIIGMTENVNRSNMDAAFYFHAVINLVPRVRQYVRQLNQSLVRIYDPSLELDFESPVPEDVEAKLKEAQTAVNGWLTIDEVRELYGKDPLPDHLGEQLYIDNRRSPISSVADGTALPIPAPGASTAPQRVSDSGDEQEDEDVDTKAHSGVKKKT